ncbi:copper chaperone PCu(A)C [Leucobacter denitrificans]|uniref:Copper chaperone PCu(A)C n=1 Tax=Leucobacter denitrificans TaxID=683042 RepID=A0A7G9S4U1_9MICO|nr:copper chaperone PCu(A)C [Leucobacter denitrificans]QNN62866.1 copper chaperone PCu(A)C [Leucobacter denitrificans]
MIHTFRTQRSRRAAIASAVAAFTLTVPVALSACTTAGAAPEHTESSATSNTPANSTEHTQVHALDVWAKATAADMEPGEGMTGVFAVLENHGDADLTITSVTSNSAKHVELHEVVNGQMREIAGDVIIPAGGSLLLEPGGNHIMLMGITDPLLPGDEVSIELGFTDGSALELSALVKDTAGANESYDESHDSDGGHDGH